MAAANTDKFKKLARRWVGSIGSGGVADESVTTIPLSSTTDLPTDTAVVAVIDRVDANGTATPSLEETVIGVVSGDNLISCVRGAEGTAQAHSAGAVVEILVTAKGWNDMVDGFLAEHSQLGAHTTDTINEKTDAAGVTVDSCLIKDGNAAKATVLSTTAKARAYLTSNQTIPKNTWTKITLNSENYDVGSNFDKDTNYRFTAPVNGYYLVTAQIGWGAMGANNFYTSIRVNGGDVATVLMKPAAGTCFSQNPTTVVYMTANQYVELYGYQDSAGDVTAYNGSQTTYMAVHLLSV